MFIITVWNKCWRQFVKDSKNEPQHDKTNKVTVRPAKTQISLGICPVWSESSLFAWRNLGSLATHWVHSKDWSDWAEPRLIWVIAERTAILLVLSCHSSNGLGNSEVYTVWPSSFRGFLYLLVWATTWNNQQNECVPSEDSDQPGHLPSLISLRCALKWVSEDPSFRYADIEDWSDWADAQADLSLCWTHSHFVGFVMLWLK